MGFTLVELLVVIAIIGVLVALLLPAVQAAREAARRSSCANNLKNLGLALHNYHDTNNAFPFAGRSTYNNGTSTVVRDFSWHARILPFIEQQPLYDRIDWTTGWDNATVGANGISNKQISEVKLKVLLCPSSAVETTESSGDVNTGATGYVAHYVGVLGPVGTNTLTGSNYTCDRCTGSSSPAGYGGYALQGILRHDKAQGMANVTDGLSNTLMIGELSWNKAAGYRVWTRGAAASDASVSGKNVLYALKSSKYGTGVAFNDVSFGSEHPGVAQFAMGDASVRPISANMSMNLYRALASANGGEPSIEN
jgi:prepilin-type N-terminal cleavage/methylation domain-containing protein